MDTISPREETPVQLTLAVQRELLTAHDSINHAIAAEDVDLSIYVLYQPEVCHVNTGRDGQEGDVAFEKLAQSFDQLLDLSNNSSLGAEQKVVPSRLSGRDIIGPHTHDYLLEPVLLAEDDCLSPQTSTPRPRDDTLQHIEIVLRVYILARG